MRLPRLRHIALAVLMFAIGTTLTRSAVAQSSVQIVVTGIPSVLPSASIDDFVTNVRQGVYGLTLIHGSPTGSAVEIRLHFELEGGGTTLLQATSEPFLLASGVQTLMPALGSGGLVQFAAGLDELLGQLPATAAAAYDVGQFPDGDYMLQIEAEAIDPASFLTAAPVAVHFSVNYLEPPELIAPVDETVWGEMPTFSWEQPAGVSPRSLLTYEFTLVEIEEGQSAGDAIAGNFVYAQRSNLTQPFLLYTPEFLPLEPFRQYAWQIRAADANGATSFQADGFSEIATFRYHDDFGAPESGPLVWSYPEYGGLYEFTSAFPDTTEFGVELDGEASVALLGTEPISAVFDFVRLSIPDLRFEAGRVYPDAGPWVAMRFDPVAGVATQTHPIVQATVSAVAGGGEVISGVRFQLPPGELDPDGYQVDGATATAELRFMDRAMDGVSARFENVRFSLGREPRLVSGRIDLRSDVGVEIGTIDPSGLTIADSPAGAMPTRVPLASAQMGVLRLDIDLLDGVSIDGPRADGSWLLNTVGGGRAVLDVAAFGSDTRRLRARLDDVVIGGEGVYRSGLLTVDEIDASFAELVALQTGIDPERIRFGSDGWILSGSPRVDDSFAPSVDVPLAADGAFRYEYAINAVVADAWITMPPAMTMAGVSVDGRRSGSTLTGLVEATSELRASLAFDGITLADVHVRREYDSMHLVHLTPRSVVDAILLEVPGSRFRLRSVDAVELQPTSDGGYSLLLDGAGRYEWDLGSTSLTTREVPVTLTASQVRIESVDGPMQGIRPIALGPLSVSPTSLSMPRLRSDWSGVPDLFAVRFQAVGVPAAGSWLHEAVGSLQLVIPTAEVVEGRLSGQLYRHVMEVGGTARAYGGLDLRPVALTGSIREVVLEATVRWLAGMSVPGCEAPVASIPIGASGSPEGVTAILGLCETLPAGPLDLRYRASTIVFGDDSALIGGGPDVMAGDRVLASSGTLQLNASNLNVVESSLGVEESFIWSWPPVSSVYTLAPDEARFNDDGLLLGASGRLSGATGPEVRFDEVLLKLGARDRGTGSFRVQTDHVLTYLPQQGIWRGGVAAAAGASLTVPRDMSIGLGGFTTGSATSGEIQMDALTQAGLDVVAESETVLSFRDAPLVSGSLEWRAGPVAVARLDADGFRLLDPAADVVLPTRIGLPVETVAYVETTDSEGRPIVRAERSEFGHRLVADGPVTVVFPALTDVGGAPLRVQAVLDAVRSDDGFRLVAGSVGVVGQVDFSAYGYPVLFDGLRYSAVDGRYALRAEGSLVLPSILADLIADPEDAFIGPDGTPQMNLAAIQGASLAEVSWQQGSVRLELLGASIGSGLPSTLEVRLLTPLFASAEGHLEPLSLGARYTDGSWTFASEEGASIIRSVHTLTFRSSDPPEFDVSDASFEMRLAGAVSLPKGFDADARIRLEALRLGSRGIEMELPPVWNASLFSDILTLDGRDPQAAYRMETGELEFTLESPSLTFFDQRRSASGGTLRISSNGSTSLPTLDLLGGSPVDLIDGFVRAQQVAVDFSQDPVLRVTGSIVLPAPLGARELPLSVRADTAGVVTLDRADWPEFNREYRLGDNPAAEYALQDEESYFELTALDLITDLRASESTELRGWGVGYVLTSGGRPAPNTPVAEGRRLLFGDPVAGDSRPGLIVSADGPRWALHTSRPSFRHVLSSDLKLGISVTKAVLGGTGTFGSGRAMSVVLSGNLQFDGMPGGLAGLAKWGGMVFDAEGFSGGTNDGSFMLSAGFGQVVLEVGDFLHERDTEISIMRKRMGSPLGTANQAASLLPPEDTEGAYRGAYDDVEEPVIPVKEVIRFYGPTGGSAIRGTVSTFFRAQVGEFVYYNAEAGQGLSGSNPVGFALRDVVLAVGAPIGKKVPKFSAYVDIEYEAGSAGNSFDDFSLRVAGSFTFAPIQKKAERPPPVARENRVAQYVADSPGEGPAKPPNRGGALVGKIGHRNGETSVGLFGAFWYPIPLVGTPGVIDLTGGGLGFFYNPDPADIDAVLRVTGVREVRSRPNVEDLDFAVLLFAQVGMMKVGTVYSIEARGLLQVTGAYTKLDVNGSLQAEFQPVGKQSLLNGTFYLQAFYANGIDDSVWDGAANLKPSSLSKLFQFDTEVQFSFFLALRGGDVRAWAVDGSVENLKVLAFDMSGQLLASKDGVYVDFEFATNQNFWVVRFDGGVKGAVWYYRPAKEFGAYAEVFFSANVDWLGVGISATAKGALLVSGSDYLIYMAARARVKLVVTSVTVRVWLALQNAKIRGGWGRDESRERLIEESMERMTSLASARDRLDDEIRDSRLDQYRLTREQLRAAGLALLEMPAEERRDYAERVLEAERYLGGNVSPVVLARAERIITAPDRPLPRTRQIAAAAQSSDVALAAFNAERASLHAALDAAELELSLESGPAADDVVDIGMPAQITGESPFREGFSISTQLDESNTRLLTERRTDDVAYQGELRALLNELRDHDRNLGQLIGGEGGILPYAAGFYRTLDAVALNRSLRAAEGWEQVAWVRGVQLSELRDVHRRCIDWSQSREGLAVQRILALLYGMRGLPTPPLISCRVVDSRLELEMSRTFLEHRYLPSADVRVPFLGRPRTGLLDPMELLFRRLGTPAVLPSTYVNTAQLAGQMERRLGAIAGLLADRDGSFADGLASAVQKAVETSPWRNATPPTQRDVTRILGEGFTGAWEWYQRFVDRPMINMASLRGEWLRSATDLWTTVLNEGIQEFKQRRTADLAEILEDRADLETLLAEQAEAGRTLQAAVVARARIAKMRQSVLVEVLSGVDSTDVQPAAQDSCVDPDGETLCADLQALRSRDAGASIEALDVTSGRLGTQVSFVDASISIANLSSAPWTGVVQLIGGGLVIEERIITGTNSDDYTRGAPILASTSSSVNNTTIGVTGGAGPIRSVVYEEAPPPPGRAPGAVRFWLPRTSEADTGRTLTVRLRLWAANGDELEESRSVEIPLDPVPQDWFMEQEGGSGTLGDLFR